jgi:hypothetical protein
LVKQSEGWHRAEFRFKARAFAWHTSGLRSCPTLLAEIIDVPVEANKPLKASTNRNQCTISALMNALAG